MKMHLAIDIGASSGRHIAGWVEDGKIKLREIYRFDKEKFDGLKDLVFCSEPAPFGLWTLPEADLARHPHISKAEAHSIVLYREHQPREAWTLEGLKKAGVLSEEHADRLSLCKLD